MIAPAVGDLVRMKTARRGIAMGAQGRVTEIEEGEPQKVRVTWTTLSWSNPSDVVEVANLEVLTGRPASP
jgi:hypothetical protein